MKILGLRHLIAIILVLAPGCSEKVPDGRILIRNDTDDKTYNRIRVSGSGIEATLKPGESALLPRSTLKFTVSRAYKDYTRTYKVECPPIKGRGISIRLIDIHVNRIAGNCVTVGATK